MYDKNWISFGGVRMNNANIMDVIQNGIENVIFKDWRHEGWIGAFSSDFIYFEVDGKFYTLTLVEGKREDLE